MKFPQSVGEVLREQVVLESESIDRMYLNVYAPQLQPTGGVVWYLRGHLGQRFASTVGIAPNTEQFVAAIEKFAKRRGVDVVSFRKDQRKVDVTREYLAKFEAVEGVLYIGRRKRRREWCAPRSGAVRSREPLTRGWWMAERSSITTTFSVWTRTLVRSS